MGGPFYMPSGYHNPYGQSIAELMLRQGDVAAQRAGQSGAIWGSALANVGNIVGAAIEQHQAKKEGEKRDAALGTLMNSNVWMTDPQAATAGAVRILGPRDGPKFAEGMFGALKMHGAQDPAEAMKALPMVARGLLAAPESMRPGLYSSVRSMIVNAKLATPDQIPEQWSKELEPYVGALSGQKDEGSIIDTVGPDGKPVKRRVSAQELAAGVPLYEKPPAEKQYQVTVPGPNGPVTRLATEAEMKAGVREYQKPPASLVVNPQREEDSQSNAQSMVDGRALPSTFSKRGSDFNHLIALADKKSMEQTGKHFSPVKLQLDYDAAKRFISNMNGPQMIRFKALAGSVVNTMDEVKSLAEELKQGGVQKWNQAKRDTVLQVYGNTPQSELAARYVSAVNTLKEEFANLAQGGYAPTEDAWKLADQQINGNFGLKDMTASLTEAQRLINYRMGAFQELTPTFAGGGEGSVNLGAPAPKPASEGSTPSARPKAVPANYHWNAELRLWVP